MSSFLAIYKLSTGNVRLATIFCHPPREKRNPISLSFQQFASLYERKRMLQKLNPLHAESNSNDWLDRQQIEIEAATNSWALNIPTYFRSNKSLLHLAWLRGWERKSAIRRRFSFCPGTVRDQSENDDCFSSWLLSAPSFSGKMVMTSLLGATLKPRLMKAFQCILYQW